MNRWLSQLMVLLLSLLAAPPAAASGSFGPVLEVIMGLALKRTCDVKVPGFEAQTKHNYEKWLSTKKEDIEKTKVALGEKNFEAAIQQLVDGARALSAQDLEPDCRNAAEWYADCARRLEHKLPCTD